MLSPERQSRLKIQLVTPLVGLIKVVKGVFSIGFRTGGFCEPLGWIYGAYHRRSGRRLRSGSRCTRSGCVGFERCLEVVPLITPGFVWSFAACVSSLRRLVRVTPPEGKPHEQHEQDKPQKSQQQQNDDGGERGTKGHGSAVSYTTCALYGTLGDQRAAQKRREPRRFDVAPADEQHRRAGS